MVCHRPYRRIRHERASRELCDFTNSLSWYSTSTVSKSGRSCSRQACELTVWHFNGHLPGVTRNSRNKFRVIDGPMERVIFHGKLC